MCAANEFGRKNAKEPGVRANIEPLKNEMAKMGTMSRHQERTEITRARLIQSAEKIFARDGFEAAKLEEIAADAGYTRGAFYANFDSKEDLFLRAAGEGNFCRVSRAWSGKWTKSAIPKPS